MPAHDEPLARADQTVSEIAAFSPAMREILHKYGLDLCCGGVHPLRMAAQAHGVDLQRILSELNAAATVASFMGEPSVPKRRLKDLA